MLKIDLGSWIGKAIAGIYSTRILSYVLAQSTVALQSYTEVPQFVWVNKFPHFFIKILEPRRELLLRSLYPIKYNVYINISFL